MNTLCPYCNTHINAYIEQVGSAFSVMTEEFWKFLSYDCPNGRCRRTVLTLSTYTLTVDHLSNRRPGEFKSARLIEPLSRARKPVPTEVPDAIRQEYEEACAVLPMSPMASAALSRRCLQHILREYGNTTKKDLADQITEVINEGSMPSYLADDIDAIRNTGNFAAHPQKSKHTGEILPVEPGEAEWNLEVLEALFDFYFVQPAKAAERRNKLNAKLNEAGKPDMKQS